MLVTELLRAHCRLSLAHLPSIDDSSPVIGPTLHLSACPSRSTVSHHATTHAKPPPPPHTHTPQSFPFHPSVPIGSGLRRTFDPCGVPTWSWWPSLPQRPRQADMISSTSSSEPGEKTVIMRSLRRSMNARIGTQRSACAENYSQQCNGSNTACPLTFSSASV